MTNITQTLNREHKTHDTSVPKDRRARIENLFQTLNAAWYRSLSSEFKVYWR